MLLQLLECVVAGAELGVRQVVERTGRITNLPSVSSVREKTGLSQLNFAVLLGVSVRTLQEWEQGRRARRGPRGPG